jgi:hypothetical protein
MTSLKAPLAAIGLKVWKLKLTIVLLAPLIAILLLMKQVVQLLTK